MFTRALATIAAVLAAFAVVACGGDDAPSADDYAAELDSACTTFQQQLENAPTAEQEQGVGPGALTQQYTDEFEAAVTGAEPPADLEDEANALNDALTSPPDPKSSKPAAYVDYYGQLQQLFSDVGATGCADIQAENVKTLKDIQGGLFSG